MVRHKTLDLVSQVRILAPQPKNGSQFMNKKVELITGNSNLPLAQKISDYLNIPLCDAEIGRNIRNKDRYFKGGEVYEDKIFK